MAKQIFVNLPVKDLAKATEFYEGLGFTKNPAFSDDNASALAWSDTIIVMLLREDFFQKFIEGKTIADATKTVEVLNCLSFDNPEELDAFADKADELGGRSYKTAYGQEVEEQSGGAMYGRDIEDLDGHIWELMYMDTSKLSQEDQAA